MRKRRATITWGALAFAWLAASACAGSDVDEGAQAPTVAPNTSTSTPSVLPGDVQPVELQAVNDFLYQLQELDLAAVGRSAYDMIVMDYSADGTEAGAYTRAQIEGLKRSPGGPKIVLAYMSIGEAEEYRYYWQPGWRAGNPRWLDQPNPTWVHNHKVQYWDSQWQQIIFAYTDRLIDAGFDGAYLDIIDGFEYFESKGRGSAAQEMAAFVAAIAAHARRPDIDFLIFPQNGAALARLVPDYLNSVDGIGQEDTYYGYDEDNVRTPADATAEIESDLDLFRAAGKLVLTVDYATAPANIDDAYKKSFAKGYVPFVTTRDLDTLTINRGHEPD